MKDWTLYLVFIPIILILAGLGCALRYGKAYGLINGYRSMNEEQKKKVDVEGLARFLGLCLIIGAAVGAAGLALLMLGVGWAGIALLLLLLPGLIYMIVRAQKFDGNAVRSDGRMTTQTKVTIVMLIIVLGGLTAGVLAMIRASGSPVVYNMPADTLKIQCTFGATVKRADIAVLTLTDERPAIASRTYGSALGEKLRGTFALDGGKSAQVYVENATPPFIEFTAGNKLYIINCETPEETRALYDKLK